MHKIGEAIIFCNRPISGFYKHKVFHLFPASESWPQPPSLSGDHPLRLDIFLNDVIDSFLVKEKIEQIHSRRKRVKNYMPNWVFIQDLVRKAAEDIIILLSTLTNYRFYQYTEKQSWFIPYTDGKFKRESMWGQEGYFIHSTSLKKVYSSSNSSLEMISAQKYYNIYGARLSTRFISFPDSINGLLDKYFSLTEAKLNTFKKACTLFYNGLTLKDDALSLSLALSSFVSSIETIIHFEERDESIKSCECCGQPIHHISRKFREFLMNYGSSQSYTKKYANRIYGLRSKILHQGRLLLGDVSRSSHYLPDSVEIEHLIRFLRICLINWLIRVE